MKTFAKILIISGILALTAFSMTQCRNKEQIYILNLSLEEVAEGEPLIMDFSDNDTIYLLPKNR